MKETTSYGTTDWRSTSIIWRTPVLLVSLTQPGTLAVWLVIFIGLFYMVPERQEEQEWEVEAFVWVCPDELYCETSRWQRIGWPTKNSWYSTSWGENKLTATSSVNKQSRLVNLFSSVSFIADTSTRSIVHWKHRRSWNIGKVLFLIQMWTEGVIH